jgi:hypothetical protein
MWYWRRCLSQERALWLLGSTWIQNVVFKAGAIWLARTLSDLEELFKGSRAYADVSNWPDPD